MKSKYIFRQYALKALTLCGLIAAAIGIVRFCLVIFAKPENQIVFTDYSRVVLENPNCKSLTTNTAVDRFPLAISYNTSSFESQAVSDDGTFVANLKITGAEKIFLTMSGEEYNAKGQSQIIESSGKTTFLISASLLSAASASSPSQFNDLLPLMPNPHEGESPFIYMFDDPPDVPDYFDWINTTPSIYRVGFCGENLAFNPDYDAASMTDLFALGLEITSSSRNAYSFAFRDVKSIKINGHSIPHKQEILIRIILPSKERLPRDTSSSVITMTAVGLSEPSIRMNDASTHIFPGLIYDSRDYGISAYTGKTQGTSALQITGNNKLFIVNSPKGWWSTGYARINIPETSQQIILSSEIGKVDFLKDKENFVHTLSDQRPIETIFKGSNLSMLSDGDEVFYSKWDKLAPELQGAYLAAIVAILTAIASYAIQKFQGIKRFISWQFSFPIYIPPVILGDDAYIFKLINGKKISGIIDTYEGRSTFRVFVLKEVREWDKDNWSEVLPTEVRVPQNQIEMYYKAHP